MRDLANHRIDLETGLLFLAFGGGTAYFALDYPIGSAGAMGSGYFPLALGILLGLIGGGFVVKALLARRDSEATKPVPLVTAGIMLLALVAFAATITTLGMVVAIPLVVFISLYASPDFSLTRATVLSVSLLALSWLIFSYGLGIAMPVHPWSR